MSEIMRNRGALALERELLLVPWAPGAGETPPRIIEIWLHNWLHEAPSNKKGLPKNLASLCFLWCPGTELNCRHGIFSRSHSISHNK